VTHPFHPLFGRQVEFVARRRNWGEDRVYYPDEGGELGSLSTAWTDVAEVDPFVMMAVTVVSRPGIRCTRPRAEPEWYPRSSRTSIFTDWTALSRQR
jgi:hypothetical protein